MSRKGNQARVRRRNPKIHQGNNGVEIQCPFCFPPHQLAVDIRARCGTILELKAIQLLYSSVKCALCGGMQGTMVKIGERYRHSFDCKPGHKIYTVPPEVSRSAEFFWNWPNRFHTFMWKYLRKKITKVSSEGKITGYAWERVEHGEI